MQNKYNIGDTLYYCNGDSLYSGRVKEIHIEENGINYRLTDTVNTVSGEPMKTNWTVAEVQLYKEPTEAKKILEEWNEIQGKFALLQGSLVRKS